MHSKCCAILVMLAALPVFAQMPDSDVSPAVVPFQHAPMRIHGVPVPGAVTSDNWSGYAVTGSAFTNAQGSWIVPKVTCSVTPNSYSAFWVGIDGYSSTTVEQTGTISYCNGSTPVYYAWYEFYPQVSIEIGSVPVKPGHKMSASVVYNGSEFTVSITNETTGKTYSKSAKVAGAKRSSAEWIAEAPCCTSSGGILPLSDFGTGAFGDDFTTINDTNYATDSAVTGPISDFRSHVEKITMVNSSDVKKAVPSALTTDGSSFKVTWKSE